MTFYWFGDSWVFGAELELQVNPLQRNSHTFAELVSSHYGARCVNMSARGNSINSIPLEFNKVINNINPATDRVFFFLTANHRISMFDEAGQLKNIIPSTYINHNVHPYQKQWYKYFDNPHQRLYNYDCVINLLHYWCKSLNIDCYFSNIFTTNSTNILNYDATIKWLLPQDKCIAEWILPLIDNDTFSIITNDNASLTNEQWQIQKQHVEKYIKPCHAHPNIVGHQEIAKNIIGLLNANI